MQLNVLFAIALMTIAIRNSSRSSKYEKSDTEKIFKKILKDDKIAASQL
jgi:hypothetical protein